MKIEELLSGEIKIIHLPINSVFEITFSEEQPWVKEMLTELEELASFDTGIDLENGHIKIDCTIVRKNDQSYGDHLVFRGFIKSKYFSPCVKCLKPTMQVVEADFATCVLPGNLENTPEFEDTNTLYIDNDELELYYYQKGIVDLQHIIHEQLFMNVEPLPLHDENCQGLCPICGIDKNTEECDH